MYDLLLKCNQKFLTLVGYNINSKKLEAPILYKVHKRSCEQVCFQLGEVICCCCH